MKGKVYVARSCIRRENQMREAESGVERIWVQERSKGQITDSGAARSQGLS